MALYLEIKTGAKKGQTFKLKKGLRIGRSSGEVVLEDSKISSLHAEIDLNKDGSMILRDRNSSNGTWVDDEKVKTVAMMPGVVFRVGRIQIGVIEAPDKLSAAKEEKPEKPRIEWAESLTQWLPEMLGEDSPSPVAAIAFESLVKLEFISGPQTDEVVFLGYGPRSFGASSLDFELQDPMAPFQAFEILSQNGQAYFMTKEPGNVSLNDTNIASDFLKEGDVIQVGGTRIRVAALK